MRLAGDIAELHSERPRFPRLRAAPRDWERRCAALPAFGEGHEPFASDAVGELEDRERVEALSESLVSPVATANAPPLGTFASSMASVVIAVVVNGIAS